MSAGVHDFEALLREALAPVDPPEDLLDRLEVRLVNLTELAQDELESWELSAMRDPRNWARPAVALVVGSSAGAALVLLRVRHRQRSLTGPADVRELTERTLRDLRGEASKLLGRR
jgi:hypothetical protein